MKSATGIFPITPPKFTSSLCDTDTNGGGSKKALAAISRKTIYPGGSLMKRILSRSLVLSLCLLLPLLAMIGGCDRAEKSSAPDALGQATTANFSLAESPMSWSDAVAYCQQQGGKLPRINNSDSWAWDDRGEKITHIDGFGTRGAPWPSGLPSADYWTETECADRPDRAWVVRYLSGTVNVLIDFQSIPHRVACVP